MIEQSTSTCSVCGNAPAAKVPGYLVLARSNPSRIMILRWNRTLASREAAQTACSPEHALEMVAHWMVSGRLDFNFTQPAQQLRGPQAAKEKPASPRASAAEYQTIGELVIDRDSVRDLVASDPEALASVLDSLLEALLRDSRPSSAKKPVLSSPASRRASIA